MNSMYYYKVQYFLSQGKTLAMLKYNKSTRQARRSCLLISIFWFSDDRKDFNYHIKVVMLTKCSLSTSLS